MAKKVSMVALDKYEKRLSIPLKVFVRYEKRAASTGRSVSEEMNIELARGVKDIPFTPELKARFDELYAENLEHRKVIKAKKGVR